MDNTVVFDQSPAYTVLEFAEGSVDNLDERGSASQDRQTRILDALEEAGVIVKFDNEALLEVAPATREKYDDLDELSEAASSVSGRGEQLSEHDGEHSVRGRAGSRVRRNSVRSIGAETADGDKAEEQEAVVVLNSGTVPTGALVNLMNSDVHFALEAVTDADIVLNREVVSVPMDEANLEVDKRKILQALDEAGFDITEVHDGKSIAERLELKVSTGYETAFYIMDVDVVLRKHRQWLALLDRVKIRYAIKCCPDPVLLKVLSTLNVGFDVASQHEIQLALDLNTPAEKIIFANPCKPVSHISFAKDKNIRLMTFDNAAELVKVKENFPEAEMVLRILPPNNSAAVCNFGSKFGASVRESERLLDRAKDLGVKVVGVSFHVGSGCFTLTAYEDALKQARKVFDMGIARGFDMRVLDIGGGFPGADDGALTFKEIADCIRPLLDQLFPKEVKIIAEPGRYFASECMTLAANIVSRRVRPNFQTNEEGEEEEAEEASFMYYISDGVYGSFNCIFFDHAVPQPSVLKRANQEDPKKRSSTFFGPTCDSIDVICKDVDMPELEVGDWLYFPNMGAYTRAAGSSFNGFPLPKVFYICS